MDSEQKCVRLIAAFKLMQVNRKIFKQLMTDRQVEEQVERQLHAQQHAKPHVSETSKQLAEEKRKKSKQPEDKEPSPKKIYDRLYEESFDQKKRKLASVANKQDKGIEECTFVPKVTHRPLKEPRNEQVFAKLHAKKLEARNYQGISTNDREFEKQRDALTFHPNLNSKWKKSALEN